MRDSSHTWQFLFFAGSAVLILLHAWRGWRLGVVRQLVTILALGCAYPAAFFGGPLLVPLLRPLGLPDRILTVVGGVLIGLLLFSAVTGFAALVFKKTSQQSVGVVRFGYGAMGAVFGAFFGLLNVWVFFLVIRLLGTIAQNGIEKQAARAPRFPVHSAQPAWMHGLVEVKKTFDEGATGRIAGRLDPVPEQVYAIAGKVTQVISSQEALARFLSHPGIKPFAQNARIAELQKDPAIMRDVLNRDFMALLRNEHLIKAVDDPELGALIRKLDIEKALDYALAKPDNREPLPGRR